jgi:leucyl aminopeptidase
MNLQKQSALALEFKIKSINPGNDFDDFYHELHAEKKGEKFDVMILPLFQKLQKNEQNPAFELSNISKFFDQKIDKNFSKILKNENFTGKLGEVLLLPDLSTYFPKINISRVLFIGAGSQENFDLVELKKLIKSAILAIKNYPHALLILSDILSDIKTPSDSKSSTSSSYANIRISTETVLNTLYQFSHYQSPENAASAPLLEKITFGLSPSEENSSIQEAKLGLLHGQAIGKAMNYVKDLGNTPGNELTPNDLAEVAKALAKKSKKVSIKVLDEKDLAKKKMLGLLSVGKGSAEPPRMILLNYKGGKKSDPTLALVGKGITFDAGGISLKPWEHMWDMKMDMLGAGTLLGVLKAAIELDLPLNFSVTIAAAENLPSGSAYKPGDIVRTYSGKTIEILNTDAEGRVVLADAITYAQELYEPKILIDVATLTGACIVALGHEYTAAITNHQETCDDLIQAGKQALDEVWQLPLNNNLRKLVKSSIADVANIGPKPQAGSILGAAFLENFIQKDTHWVHLDIAGTAMGKEASGRPVALLVQYLFNYIDARK